MAENVIEINRSHIDFWIERLPLINEMRAQGKTMVEIAPALGVGKSTVCRFLMRLKKEGHFVASVESPLPPKIDEQPNRGRACRGKIESHPAMEPGGIAWAAIWNGNPPPYPQKLVMGVFS